MSAGDTLSQLNKMNISRAENFQDSLEGTQFASQSVDAMLKASQIAATEDKLYAETEDNSAMGIQIRTKKLNPKKDSKIKKVKHTKESVLVRKEDADGLADGFSQRHGNREYRIDPRLLGLLAEDLGVAINEHSTYQALLDLIRLRMLGINPKEGVDVAIIDKAFEFLLETVLFYLTATEGLGKERLKKIYKILENAKFKHFKANAGTIQVAQNIIGAVDAVVETTGQTVKETLDHYRDVVHNPPDLQTLRKFYEKKGYKAMILELKGLNTYLGGNFKRSNLESPELAQLASAARKMQALLGVFRQSKVHIPTMKSYLSLNHVLAA